MAGMLPGVEAARRRRFHKPSQVSSSDNSGSSRRYSFCLYATAHDHHSNSTMVTRNPQESSRIPWCDESRLGAAAREAKKRLDERLQLPRSQNHTSAQERSTSNVGSNYLQHTKKLGWKSSEQDECAVCLEGLRAGTLMQLSCAHRFHTNCLLPWLEANAHCPCCRLEIPSS